MSQIRVSDAPVQTEIVKGMFLPPLWQRWLASLGTWVKNASSVNDDSVNCGRLGILNVTHLATVGASTYQTKSFPLNDTALSCSKVGVVATLMKDGSITVSNTNISDTITIISGAYILAPSLEK